MYLDHFGLREAPFSLTPDTQFYIACNSHQEAYNTLLVAVTNGEGFIKITGNVGTGKTLLCRKFLGSLDQESFVTAYLHNPYLDPRSLQFALADELKVPIDPTTDAHQLMKALTLHLIDIAREGKNAVLCLDEAQAMPLETLEVLRLLTNLETEKRKLLQVVLFGQTELDAHLAHESVRQISQRITFSHELQPLNREEVGYYVMQRLGIAGNRSGPIFSERALDELFQGSSGIPRLINILAHKSLMLAYGEGRRRVDAAEIRAAVEDTPSANRQAKSAWKHWLSFLGKKA